eukprot:CAMPEP_0116882280 /NCGR_PEP_ID=MMETSP0463-20121206/14478_1 /TAXON_ID=181622 /ORGANISM="Strombidinopsis sp, Strain SopsisLIS2011" /LENGTH=84 /DNA_ID=CAMNT_0004535239 /DNA_START=243 /DNA_END=497 /DNA_ORIENTATION=-
MVEFSKQANTACGKANYLLEDQIDDDEKYPTKRVQVTDPNALDRNVNVNLFTEEFPDVQHTYINKVDHSFVRHDLDTGMECLCV